MTVSMIISSFFSGVLGSMGLGGGTILVVYLTYFRSMAQKQAQGINLICFIPIAILSVIIYSRQKLTDKKVILPLVAYGIAGAAAGFLILEAMPQELLGKLFGGFLILLSIKEFFSKNEKKKDNKNSDT